MGGGGAGVGLEEGAALAGDGGGGVWSFDAVEARGGPPLLDGADGGGEDGVFVGGGRGEVGRAGGEVFEGESGVWGCAEEAGEGSQGGKSAWGEHCGWVLAVDWVLGGVWGGVFI